MIARNLGRNGSLVSPLCFGAMFISADAQGVSRTLLHGLERGITVIDTAQLYGDSETIIGRTLQEWRGTRPVIATKVGAMAPQSWQAPVAMDKAFPAAHVVACVEQSLKNLRVECVDLIQLHQWFDTWTGQTEWLEALRRLKTQGKVKAIGVSAQDHHHDALLRLVDSGAIDAVQVVLNIFESGPVNSLLPLCVERGVGVIARCVLDDGGLADLTTEKVRAIPRVQNVGVDQYLYRRERLRAVSGLPLSELAVRFVLSLPGVTTATMTMRDAAQVESNLAAAVAGPLKAELLAKLLERHRWSKNGYLPCP